VNNADDADRERTQTIVAEMRAAELRLALQHAVAGASHWRLHATVLLDEIASCELPPLPQEPSYE
jgi:hypothetical protein